MKKIIYSLSLLLFASCTTQQPNETSVVDSNSFDTPVIATQKSEEQIKQELLYLENSKPLKYLKLKDESLKPNEVQTRHSTWLRKAKYEIQGYLFKSNVSNTATLGKFKDLVIKITYISTTGSEISSEKITVYEFVKPNETKEISFIVNPSFEFSGYNIEIVSATPTA